jgi:NAD(P)-dependent dehydrogenase (short-subunit alcohol dehydrogenase family)
MKRFANKVVVITGAASGIGEACAIRFAEEGANIVCLDISVKANQKIAAQCREFGVEAIALHCDVTDPVSIKTALMATMEKWSRIDTLVCSAGIYTGSPLLDVSLNQWKKTIEINLTGTFLTNQAVALIMMEQRGGSIINLSSMAGKTSWVASAEYSSSKSGVIGLTRSVAMELAPYGATANAVCPGNTLTDMVRGVAGKVGALDGLTGEEWLQMRANDCPMNRLAEPWEMAGVIAFLASDDSRYLTGQAIEVDGGMVMS